MAAVFYVYDKDKDIFKSGVTFSNVVRIFEENGNDFFASMLGDPGMCIITNVAINNTDVVQYFLSFDDAIQYFYFGKGLGSMSISGMFFANCDGYMPGIGTFYNKIGENRGKPVIISLGGTAFRGVINSFSTSTLADPEPITEFQIQLGMIHHEVGSPHNFKSVC
jgi:hypothetical protein